MSADKRLTKAYRGAVVKEFDEKSKFVIFSDCHRGDDSASDEFARNETIILHALRYYYENDYTYIEAGDGDELWEHGTFHYIRAAHMNVLLEMKKFFDDNRFYMLYGNHNNYLKNQHFVQRNYYYYYDEYSERYVKLFYKIKPIESLVLKERNTGQEILVVHGHQGDILNDQLWLLAMFGVRYIWRYLRLVGIRNPSSPARNQNRRHKMERKYGKWLKENPVMLICGHTHRMKFPKKNEWPYFNIGCCVHSKGVTVIEIENNKIALVQWSVLAAKSGELCITRNILRGPEPIQWWNRYSSIKWKNKIFTK